MKLPNPTVQQPQNTHFLKVKTGLQQTKSFSAVSFPVAKQQASCLTQPYLSLQYSFSFSLVAQVTRSIAVITVALLTFKWMLWRTRHVLFLSLSVICFKGQGIAWNTLHPQPFSKCAIQECKSFLPFQWYSSTIVPTAENLLQDYTLPQYYSKENLMYDTYIDVFRRKFTAACFLSCFQSLDYYNSLIEQCPPTMQKCKCCSSETCTCHCQQIQLVEGDHMAMCMTKQQLTRAY